MTYGIFIYNKHFLIFRCVFRFCIISILQNDCVPYTCLLSQNLSHSLFAKPSAKPFRSPLVQHPKIPIDMHARNMRRRVAFERLCESLCGRLCETFYARLANGFDLHVYVWRNLHVYVCIYIYIYIY